MQATLADILLYRLMITKPFRTEVQNLQAAACLRFTEVQYMNEHGMIICYLLLSQFLMSQISHFTRPVGTRRMTTALFKVAVFGCKHV